MAELSTLEKQVKGFTDENPYAQRADYLLSLIPENQGTMLVELTAEAQANATLALAYEQRQTRFDLYVGLENHAQQTAVV